MRLLAVLSTLSLTACPKISPQPSPTLQETAGLNGEVASAVQQCLDGRSDMVAFPGKDRAVQRMVFQTEDGGVWEVFSQDGHLFGKNHLQRENGEPEIQIIKDAGLLNELADICVEPESSASRHEYSDIEMRALRNLVFLPDQGDCAGFFTYSRGIPLVVTAGHCAPVNEIVSVIWPNLSEGNTLAFQSFNYTQGFVVQSIDKIDSYIDLAVIAISPSADNLPEGLRIEDGDVTTIDAVFGHPFRAQWNMSRANETSVADGRIEVGFETNELIGGGSSGGFGIDEEGDVVALTSYYVRSSGQFQHSLYAMPGSMVLDFIDRFVDQDIAARVREIDVPSTLCPVQERPVLFSGSKVFSSYLDDSCSY